MLPFGTTDLEFSIVTFISAFVGISLIIAASRFVKTRYIAAFAFGVYLWYFTDTIGDANYLDVSQGAVFSTLLVSLVALFAIGVIAFFALDGRIFTIGEETAKYGMMVALLAALALGLHGFGEGADFGYSASVTQYNTLLGAFGGLAPEASWVLHKMLEPTIAAACYVAFAGVAAKKPVDKLVDSLTLATVFVIPAIVGSIAGYYVTFDHTYFFALGLGASVYAVARVARPMFSGAGEGLSGLSLKMAVAVVIGFLCIFISALLHS
ncbi:MAG: hypothetical protein ACLQEQ_06855 [Nitrososphaerales archaeon]